MLPDGVSHKRPFQRLDLCMRSLMQRPQRSKRGLTWKNTAAPVVSLGCKRICATRGGLSSAPKPPVRRVIVAESRMIGRLAPSR
jgi:hypothetical protein